MKTEEAVQKLIGVARRQHKALETERSYANWLRRYCRFVIERKPQCACFGGKDAWDDDDAPMLHNNQISGAKNADIL